MNTPLAITAAGIVLTIWLLRGQQRVELLKPAGVIGSKLPIPSRLAQPVFLLGLLAGGGLGWLIFGGGLGPVIGAGAGFAAAWWASRLTPSSETRQQRRLARDFPITLGFMAFVVQSGAPLRLATEAVSEVADELNAQRLRGVIARCDVGFTDGEAWRTLADDPVWGELSRELARCVDTGAATAAVLKSTAAQASQAADADAIAQARTIGVTSTLPLVCCFLPAFLLVGVVPIIGGLIGGYLSGL